MRRWFRTLPNYHLFLGVNLAIAAQGELPSGVPPYFLLVYRFFERPTMALREKFST